MQKFNGVKIVLFRPDKKILVYLRDNKPDLVYANCWDLPGGGKENSEAPFETIQREVFEEFGFNLEKSQITYSADYPSERFKDTVSIFMVGTMTEEQVNSIDFGSEGQKYTFMDIEEFLGLAKGTVVDHHQMRLRQYLTQ